MKARPMLPVIKACLGILYLADTRSVLLTQRPEGKLYAGYWEFPGGKIESAETSLAALGRELYEEIGIIAVPENMSLLETIEYEYPHGLVELDVILVRQWQGQEMAREGQQLSWQFIDEGSLPSPALPTTESVFNLLRNKREVYETVS